MLDTGAAGLAAGGVQPVVTKRDMETWFVHNHIARTAAASLVSSLIPVMPSLTSHVDQKNLCEGEK